MGVLSTVECSYPKFHKGFRVDIGGSKKGDSENSVDESFGHQS